jgi:hypothetical protein
MLLSERGDDAYFALASFKDGSSRKAENAAYLRSLFLDLDCGAGKPYADQIAAAQALSEFIQTTSLPTPTVVNSGGGLHVYWLLDADVPAAEWLPYAQSLKQLCVAQGLHCDMQVVADAARILRIPGTFNYKRDASRPVQVMSLGRPVPLESLALVLPPVVDLSAARQYGVDGTTAAVSGSDYPKSSFSKLMARSLCGRGCNQMRIAALQADSLEEPLWRGALSIAGRCEDGATAIHTLSRHHPGYDPADTEEKAAGTRGPYTCEWYRLNYPSGCAGCTERVTSPIALGRIVEESPTENDTYTVVKPEDADSPEVEMDIPKYPFPYFRGVDGGVYRRDRTKDGEEIDIEIYPCDLYLTERFFDYDEQGNGDGEMVGINLHMSRDGVRRFFAPATTLFTPDKVRDLLVRHGVVTYGKHVGELMAYFASSLRNLQSRYMANRTRNQMGWTPDMLGFVIGELEYTSQGKKLAPPASGTRQLASHFKPTGTLDEWKKIAGFYDRPGLEPHALALFFGFGSPLLKFIGPKNNVRGAMVHLKHNGSGSGKSTAQMVVNSIFGNPGDLLMKSEDTAASKMHMLGIMNSLALTVDEITNENPEVLSDMAYGFTSGRGRHRMESQSNKLRANTTTWCNITITSGNASVADTLQQFKTATDGEMRRLLEISVPKYSDASKQEIDAIFSKLPLNYGVAGPAYIQYVLQNKAIVEEALHKMQSKIDGELGLDQADRFYSCILTCAFVGASLAKKLGLIDIDVGRVYRWAIHLVKDARAHARLDLGNMLLVAQETLAAFVNENIPNALVINRAKRGCPSDAPIQMPKGALRMRYEPNTRELFIPATELRNYFAARRVDVREGVTKLAEAGIIKHDGRSQPVRIGVGAMGNMQGLSVRSYVIDGDAVGVEPTTFTAPQKDAIAD